ncbi:MAG: A/G-specific adenine glycosylase [Actinomycetes bacterium]
MTALLDAPSSPDRPDPADLHGPILRWYEQNARDLPWRAPDVTPWAVLVSEVMLQQTPVGRVLPVWREWLSRWPTPASLAAASPADAVRAWGRLSYPRRALRLHATAEALVDRHDGVVPDDHEALRALPGVGSYTAAAVAAFAFGRRHPVVDTNVRRVQARAVLGAALPAPVLTAAETRLAAELLPPDDREGGQSARWSVAVMELGALVCTARLPRCQDCPVAALCRWNHAGRPVHDGPPRRTQPWHGTDRQVRGRLLAALRASEVPLHRAVLGEVESDAEQWDRCLASLVSDGLVERLEDGTFRLPVRSAR